MPERLPLDLFAEVTTADGTKYKWDANQEPGSRPQGLRFATKIGEGFSDGSAQLARRIDQDYPDLALVNDLVLTGADGSVAYEGRLAAMPRDLGDRHSIGVTLAGHMAHAKDRRFQEIYVDRDMGQWNNWPLTRRIALAGTYSLGDFSWSQENGGLAVGLPNQALGAQTLAETWYVAPLGVKIAKVIYRGATTSLPASWEVRLRPADDYASADSYTLTFDDTLRTQTLTTNRRYIGLALYSNGSAVTPASGALIRASKVAAVGDHGLTLHTGDPVEPDGVYGSDVIRDICARFCPELDTSGVQNSDYVIQHLAFRDRTFPYDAFLEINKFHLWHLGVWEGKRLDWRPYDLTDYDWEIRTDDPGITFSPQGPSTENLFNGTEVTYTDILSGETNTLTPDVYSDLADSSLTNPWNQHGRQKWDPITLSSPTHLDSALQLGRGILADRNRPRTPGTITVKGYIRDRAGNPQPCWKPRAGQTISVTNFPNDTPRLIVETSYDDDNKEITIALDLPFATVEAYLDRQANALQAAGRG
jgi:hypothetical protein